jgi:ABC-type Zn2+ transport system substrate-binding protein/surface adhesin
MTEDSPEVERALSGIDESKRRTLIRLLRGAAFVVPVVASFSMDGLTISEVHAHQSDHPNSTDKHKKKDKKHKHDHDHDHDDDKKHKKKHKHDHDDD